MLYPQYFIDDLKNRADMVPIFAAVILLFAFAINGFAQEKPKAEQIDEFRWVTCEDLNARTDNLATWLANRPDSNVTAIISPAKDSDAKARSYSTFIKKVFERREYPLDRLRIVQGPAADSVGGAFWLVPPGAFDPGKDLPIWQDKPLDLSKPFVYGTEDEDNICPTFAPKLYANLIKSHPDLRGHIVVIPDRMFATNFKFDIAKEWIDTLTKKYGVPRNRVKIFFAKATDYEVVEFWIVPVRKK